MPAAAAASRKMTRRIAGQGMTEYLLIVALIAIGTIGVVGLFGDNIRELFGAHSAALAGNPDVGNTGRKAPAALLRKSLGGQSTPGAAAASFAYNPGGTTNLPEGSF